MIDQSLLQQLAFGHFVSGEHLAERAGCSRAAIAKRVEQLRAAGILIEARPRLGYRLGHAYDWWRPERLAPLLPAALDVHVLPEVASTNDWLRALLAGSHEHGARTQLAITDFQQGGRGRRGRSWLSPPGRQMTFSLGLTSEHGPLAWIGVALAVGVELAEALREAGWPVLLKWPNDILLDGAKLAGILVEMDAMAEGPSRVVVGVGLNECLLPAERAQLDRPVAALGDRMPDYDRHALLAAMVARLDAMLSRFPRDGLDAWLARWPALDALRGRVVDFQRGDDWLSGVALGVDAQGCLLLEAAEGRVRCHSGEVSVREVRA